jgi:hypothetical protein
MKGIVSFHPVDVDFFDGTIAPLVAGSQVDLDRYLDDVVRARRVAWQARRFARALGSILAAARFPRLEPMFERPKSAGDALRTGLGVIRSPKAFLLGLKARLELLDHRVDERSALVLERVDPDFHLTGRPFFITEASSQAVAGRVDEYRRASSPAAVDGIAVEQLVVLDRRLSDVIPEDGPQLSLDSSYRGEVFREACGLRQAARAGSSWTAAEREWGSAESGPSELAWSAVRLHARAAPFWLARDVDGLDTVCRAAGLEPPGFVAPAGRLFREASTAAPELAAPCQPELQDARDIGAFVAPEHVADLLGFLKTRGSEIIRAASRHGEGARASTLLRKIRECAVYAKAHDLGYLEAAGILPPDLEEVGVEDVVAADEPALSAAVGG